MVGWLLPQETMSPSAVEIESSFFRSRRWLRPAAFRSLQQGANHARQARLGACWIVSALKTTAHSARVPSLNLGSSTTSIKRLGDGCEMLPTVDGSQDHWLVVT